MSSILHLLRGHLALSSILLLLRAEALSNQAYLSSLNVTLNLLNDGLQLADSILSSPLAYHNLSKEHDRFVHDETMRVLMHEPEWSTKIATVPWFGDELSSACLKSCGIWSDSEQNRERSCCSFCGVYSIGNWSETSDTNKVEYAVGPWDPKWSDLSSDVWREKASRQHWSHELGSRGEQCELRRSTKLAACRAVCGESCLARCRTNATGFSFCNSTLVALGDSTVRGQAAALAARLNGVGPLDLRSHHGRSVVSCIDHELSRETRLEIVAVQEFVYNKLEQSMFFAREHEKLNEGDLVRLLRHADAVVVNVGPWDVNDVRYVERSKWYGNTSMIRQEARGLLAALKAVQFHGRLIFRGTPRGHPYCWESMNQATLTVKGVADKWVHHRELGLRWASAGFPTKNAELQYFIDEVYRWKWGYFPLVQRVFAQELMIKAIDENFDFKVLLQDVSRLGEMSVFGVDVEFVIRKEIANHVRLNKTWHPLTRGDCLHHRFPSQIDWYNAHLLNILGDVR
jgi:hypothetical protein